MIGPSSIFDDAPKQIGPSSRGNGPMNSGVITMYIPARSSAPSRWQIVNAPIQSPSSMIVVPSTLSRQNGVNAARQSLPSGSLNRAVSGRRWTTKDS